MKRFRYHSSVLIIFTLLLCTAIKPAHAQTEADSGNVPKNIKAVMDSSFYKGAIWGMRVIDLDNGQTLINLKPRHNFFIA